MHGVALPTENRVYLPYFQGQSEKRFGQEGMEKFRRSGEDRSAGAFAILRASSRSHPQRHVDESIPRKTVSNRKSLAAQGADANGTKLEQSGVHHGLMDDIAELLHVDPTIQIGRVL
jgi:hypothetical protein